MRILVWSQYFWPENFHINSVADALAKKGVEVEVLTGKPNYPGGKIFSGYRLFGCWQEVRNQVVINRVPLLPRGLNGKRLAMNYLSFVVSGILFAPCLLRRRKYDVIFVYAPSPVLQAIPAIFVGWLKGCPVVLWVQDLWPESLSATGYIRSRFALNLVERVVRYIYRHVDLLLVQSEAFIEPVRDLASGTPVEYYPNSVDESFLSAPSKAVPDIPGLGSGFSILFAGNIGAAQAVEVILQAATLLKDNKDIQFVVLGDGSRRDWMLEEVRKRKLTNIHLPGRFPVEMMPDIMQRASVLLVTLADQKIFSLTIPSKVQAYLAAGRPIVACLNGEGARLVVKSGAGVAVRAEDGEALVGAVLELYRMTSKEREAMGAKGRLFYKQHFSHDMLVNQLIELLQTVHIRFKERKPI